MAIETPLNILGIEKIYNETRKERATAALAPLRQGYEKLLEDKGKRVKLNKIQVVLAKMIGKEEEWNNLLFFEKKIKGKDPVTVRVQNFSMPGNTILVSIEGHSTELRLREDLSESHVFLGSSSRPLDELDIEYYNDLLQILQN